MIPFVKPFYDDDDFAMVKKVLQSGWVAQGPMVEAFEEAVAEYLDCNYVISVTNCTTALTLALMALGIKEGDEVIVPDFTFPATALAVTNVGATPVLVDVHIGSCNMEITKVNAVITEKTKAIIPVHLFGLGADMTEIMSLAKKHKLFVIEDAACALGTEINCMGDVSKAGTIGHIGCFSLHASKGITTGEGGLIATNDRELADKMRRLSVFGDERAYRRSRVGDPSYKIPFYFDPKAGNYKMSDITAAIGLAQIKKIDKLIDWRIDIAIEWNDVILNDHFLNNKIRIQPPLFFDHAHIYQSYVSVCQDGCRQEVMDYFAHRGFATGIGTHALHAYPTLFSEQPGQFFPVSEYLYRNAISLPRYYGLSPKEEWVKGKA